MVTVMQLVETVMLGVMVRQLVVMVTVGVRGSGEHFVDECLHKDREKRLCVSPVVHRPRTKSRVSH